VSDSLAVPGPGGRAPGGVRKIQLVTPALTHWSLSNHTGHIGILKIQVPEPNAVVLLAAGLGLLLALRRWAGRAKGVD